MFKNAKIKNSLTISYIAVLLLPFLLLIFNSGIFSKSMENKIIATNKLTLQNIKAQSDIMFKEIKSFNSQITQNPYLYSLVNAASVNADTYLGMVELQQMLINYKMLQLPIDLYFIYVVSLDIVITSDSVFSGKDFFNILELRGNLSYEDWRAQLVSAASPYDNYSMKINETERNMLFYKHPITSGEKSKINAVLVSAIDFNSIFPVSDRISGENGTVVIAKDTLPIFSFPDTDNLDIEFSEITNYSSDTVNMIRNDRKLVISYVSSDIDDLKYIYIVPYRSFWSEMINVMLMSVIEIIILIVILCFAVHFFIKKHYSPIEKIMNIAKNLTADTSLDKSNEFRFINNALININNLNKEITNKLYKQNKILANNFMSSLLTCQITNEDEILKNAGLYDIAFDSKYYTVVVVSINNVSELFAESDSEFNIPQDDFTTAPLIISNIMQEIISNKMRTIMSIVNKRIISFTVFLSSSSEAELDELHQLIEQSIQSIDDHFKIDYTVALGEPCGSPQELSRSYTKAMQALDYKFILMSERILRYDVIEKKLVNGYKFGSTEQQRLIHSINSGVFENAQNVIADIFQDNFDSSEHQLISIGSAKYLLYEIVSCIARSRMFIPKQIQDYTSEVFNSCSNIMEAKKYILGLLKKACGEANQQKIENSLKTRAENYVNEHYMDISLSLTEIADELGVSAKYLSSFYKNHSEFGLQNYINQVRIQNAINLITNTDKQFKDICLEVGYTNFRTFSRVFKSFTGVTLSQFRNSNSLPHRP